MNIQIRAYQSKDAADAAQIWNEVVATNTHALHLYERIGFKKLGIIPGGFRMPDGTYEDTIPHYYIL